MAGPVEPDEVLDVDLGGLVVLFEEFLAFHPAEVVEGGEGEGEDAVLLLEGDLELEVLELGLLAAHVGDHVLRPEFDAGDGVPLPVVEVHLHVVQADVRPLRYLVVGLEVGLQVVLRCCHLYLRRVLQHQRVLVGHVEEEGGSLEGGVLELGLHVCVDEGRYAGKLHSK